jgi:hypothetical protein
LGNPRLAAATARLQSHHEVTNTGRKANDQIRRSAGQAAPGAPVIRNDLDGDR